MMNEKYYRQNEFWVSSNVKCFENESKMFTHTHTKITPAGNSVLVILTGNILLSVSSLHYNKVTSQKATPSENVNCLFICTLAAALVHFCQVGDSTGGISGVILE